MGSGAEATRASGRGLRHDPPRDRPGRAAALGSKPAAGRRCCATSAVRP